MKATLSIEPFERKCFLSRGTNEQAKKLLLTRVNLSFGLFARANCIRTTCFYNRNPISFPDGNACVPKRLFTKRFRFLLLLAGKLCVCVQHSSRELQLSDVLLEFFFCYNFLSFFLSFREAFSPIWLVAQEHVHENFFRYCCTRCRNW